MSVSSKNGLLRVYGLISDTGKLRNGDGVDNEFSWKQRLTGTKTTANNKIETARLNNIKISEGNRDIWK